MNIACRQQMTTEKLFHKALINFIIIYLQIGNIFQLNYIENFLQIQYIWLLHACFAESLSSMIACYWTCTKNSRRLVAGTWLIGASWWKFMKALFMYEIVHVSLSFFSLTGVTEIVNAQGSLWYLTSWNKYTDTKSCHL